MEEFKNLIYAPLDFGFDEDFFKEMNNKIENKIEKNEFCFLNKEKVSGKNGVFSIPIIGFDVPSENEEHNFKKLMEVNEFRLFFRTLENNFFIRIVKMNLAYLTFGSLYYHNDLIKSIKEINDYLIRNDPCSVKVNLDPITEKSYSLFLKRNKKELQAFRPSHIKSYLCTDVLAEHGVQTYTDEKMKTLMICGITNNNRFKQKINEMEHKYKDYFIYTSDFDRKE